jgi:hypothetical protein
MKRLSKRTWVAIAIVLAIAFSAIGAFAYWTTTGSGTGSATVAASNGTVTLHGSAPTDLFPGGSSTVTFTADNAGSSNLFVGTIHLAGVSADGGHASCVTSDFSMADVTSNTMVAAGASGAALTGTGTLNYANTGANQDACKGASLTLNLTSN